MEPSQIGAMIPIVAILSGAAAELPGAAGRTVPRV